jgi:hypothetical protein
MTTVDSWPEGNPNDPAHLARLVASAVDADERYQQLETTLGARLDAASFSLVRELVHARDDLNDALDRLAEARLDRHFPGLAPALGLVRAHCLELPGIDGRCCPWVEPAPG